MYGYCECVNVDYKSVRKEEWIDIQLEVMGCKDVYASFDKITEVRPCAHGLAHRPCAFRPSRTPAARARLRQCNRKHTGPLRRTAARGRQWWLPAGLRSPTRVRRPDARKLNCHGEAEPSPRRTHARTRVQVEMLVGENKYDAEKFGHQDAKRGVLLDALPPVLQLHLKRFDFDLQHLVPIKARRL
jgi:hypothetical protein